MKIGKIFHFEAAHRLAGWPKDHKCYQLHGHSYKVEVEVDGPVNPETGSVVDFGEITKRWQYIFNTLDHQNLNEVLTVENTTAEYLAALIMSMFNWYMITRVRVWETENAWAEIKVMK
jgi:6-pyruvoyltetrahydropterin/6-carboxytetrahydropterin synthase